VIGGQNSFQRKQGWRKTSRVAFVWNTRIRLEICQKIPIAHKRHDRIGHRCRRHFVQD
jgi:hypothetical protein